MNPTTVTSWVNAVNLLLPLGVNVVNLLHGWLTSAHPTLTLDQINAAYVAILTDNALREAFAARASVAS